MTCRYALSFFLRLVKKNRLALSQAVQAGNVVSKASRLPKVGLLNCRTWIMVFEAKSARRDARPTGSAAAERRREPRYPCADSIEVRIASDDDKPIPAALVEVSRSGVHLRVGVPIAKGTEIQVRVSKRLVVSGRVRHCRRVGETYQAGISILEASYSAKLTGHVSGEQLSSYLTGKSLIVTDVIRIREHLAACKECRLRIVESYTSGRPRRKSR